MIPCSNRIQEILEWVNGECIADIGCDHAYVVCNAILNHQSKKGYACDVAQGPLDNAKKTIEENHLSDFVSCRLLDGIQGLESDVDQIIICGMGGKLICYSPMLYMNNQLFAKILCAPRNASWHPLLGRKP